MGGKRTAHFFCHFLVGVFWGSCVGFRLGSRVFGGDRTPHELASTWCGWGVGPMLRQRQEVALSWVLRKADCSMGWQEAVESTVTGMGYDLVEVQRTAGGLLRITIDLPYVKGQPSAAVTVEDCEAVTRQLQFLLEVEAVDYKRLEVGSPGIDRLLRHEADLERFEGELIDLTLRDALGPEMGAYANRKKFRGTLERAESGEGWQVVWTEAPVRKPGAKVSKHAKPLPLQALQFIWSEVREARLADVVDFKGRQAASQDQSDDDIAESGDGALNVE